MRGFYALDDLETRSDLYRSLVSEVIVRSPVIVVIAFDRPCLLTILEGGDRDAGAGIVHIVTR